MIVCYSCRMTPCAPFTSVAIIVFSGTTMYKTAGGDFQRRGWISRSGTSNPTPASRPPAAPSPIHWPLKGRKKKRRHRRHRAERFLRPSRVPSVCRFPPHDLPHTHPPNPPPDGRVTPPPHRARSLRGCRENVKTPIDNGRRPRSASTRVTCSGHTHRPRLKAHATHAIIIT